MPSGIYKRTKKHGENLGKAQIGNKKCVGRIYSKEARKKMSDALKGHKHSEETRRKISEACKGERSSQWKGGISTENNKIRGSIESRLWREAVFARDNYTCQKTGIKGGKLNSHHINNFANYPELRFAIDNGVTLSEKAHNEFHKIYGRRNTTKDQLIEFLTI